MAKFADKKGTFSDVGERGHRDERVGREGQEGVGRAQGSNYIVRCWPKLTEGEK